MQDVEDENHSENHSAAANGFSISPDSSHGHSTTSGTSGVCVRNVQYGDKHGDSTARTDYTQNASRGRAARPSDTHRTDHTHRTADTHRTDALDTSNGSLNQSDDASPDDHEAMMISLRRRQAEDSRGGGGKAQEGSKTLPSYMRATAAASRRSTYAKQSMVMQSGTAGTVSAGTIGTASDNREATVHAAMRVREREREGRQQRKHTTGGHMAPPAVPAAAPAVPHVEKGPLDRDNLPSYMRTTASRRHGHTNKTAHPQQKRRSTRSNGWR